MISLLGLMTTHMNQAEPAQRDARKGFMCGSPAAAFLFS
jgi:hypothetical protein